MKLDRALRRTFSLQTFIMVTRINHLKSRTGKLAGIALGLYLSPLEAHFLQ